MLFWLILTDRIRIHVSHGVLVTSKKLPILHDTLNRSSIKREKILVPTFTCLDRFCVSIRGGGRDFWLARISFIKISILQVTSISNRTKPPGISTSVAARRHAIL